MARNPWFHIKPSQFSGAVQRMIIKWGLESLANLINIKRQDQKQIKAGETLSENK